MTAVFGLTDEYWGPRDIGPLPERADGRWFYALAKEQCMDWQGGRCIRTGQTCALAGNRRCGWFEVAVLPAEENKAVAAEYENVLRGVVVGGMGIRAADRVRMALEDLAKEKKRITSADVVRYAGLSAVAVRRHISGQAKALGLVRQGRKKGTVYVPNPETVGS